VHLLINTFMFLREFAQEHEGVDEFSFDMTKYEKVLPMSSDQIVTYVPGRAHGQCDEP
jgi:hypothetical protein